MESKNTKLVLASIVGLLIFLGFLFWGLDIYTQNENEHIEKEKFAEWRIQTENNHLREIDRRLQKLESELFFLKGNSSYAECQQAQIQPPTPLPSVPPAPPPPPMPPPRVTNEDDMPNVFVERKRHYFQKCRSRNFAKIIKGMSKEKIRNLCGGQEYPPFEIFRSGFAFALNEERSSFYSFKGWMPVDQVGYDFFSSDDKKLLYVRYDSEGHSEVVQQFPISQQELSSQEAGVQITQPDARTLQLQMDVTPPGR